MYCIIDNFRISVDSNHHAERQLFYTENFTQCLPFRGRQSVVNDFSPKLSFVLILQKNNKTVHKFGWNKFRSPLLCVCGGGGIEELCEECLTQS